jgi:hypothetical protein
VLKIGIFGCSCALTWAPFLRAKISQVTLLRYCPSQKFFSCSLRFTSKSRKSVGAIDARGKAIWPLLRTSFTALLTAERARVPVPGRPLPRGGHSAVHVSRLHPQALLRLHPGCQEWRQGGGPVVPRSCGRGNGGPAQPEVLTRGPRGGPLPSAAVVRLCGR